MSPHAGWHTDDFPEFRERPPWVMQEMIESEPGLAAPVFATADEAGAIGAAVIAAVDAGEMASVVGCGTSEHASMAVAEQLDEALRAAARPGGRVGSRQAFEAFLDPRMGGICVAVSHEGATAATVAALRAARAAGAATAAITAMAGSPVTGASDHVVVTPIRDRSWCHTVGYVSPILAGGSISAAVRGDASDGSAAEAVLAAGLKGRERVAEMAAALHGVRRFLLVGGGADRIAARELALKIEEGVRVPATARDLETILHGHWVALDDGSAAVVLLLTDRRRGAERLARAEQMLRAARRIGARTAAIVTPAADAGLPAETTSAGRIVVPSDEALPASLDSLLGSAVALQLLTLELAHLAGVNPDLIRREEAPYREAAEIAESGFPASLG